MIPDTSTAYVAGADPNAHLTPEECLDYSLGLLKGAARARAVRHLQVCQACRLATAQEEQVGRQIQAALRTVPLPAPARLAALHPGVRLRRTRRMRHALALAGLLITLWLGNLGWQRNLPAHFNQFPTPTTRLAPTSVAAATTTLPPAGLTPTVTFLSPAQLTLPAPRTTPSSLTPFSESVTP